MKYIEDQMFAWLKEGKTWEEINLLRKQEPFRRWSSRTHKIANALALAIFSNNKNMQNTNSSLAAQDIGASLRHLAEIKNPIHTRTQAQN